MHILASIAAVAAATTTPVSVPGGNGGIGFDDLTFSSGLHRLIVPGGRTGNLDLVDPATKEVTAISGFSKESKFGGGHGEGTTSADEGRGLLFASDRSKRLLVVVDPARRAVVASVKLDAGPDTTSGSSRQPERSGSPSRVRSRSKSSRSRKGARPLPPALAWFMSQEGRSPS